MFHHLWTAVEDACLVVWVRYRMTLKPRHLPLHFDGIRIDAESVMDKECLRGG